MEKKIESMAKLLSMNIVVDHIQYLESIFHLKLKQMMEKLFLEVIILLFFIYIFKKKK